MIPLEWILLGVVIVFLFAVTLVGLVFYFNEFSRELRYLNMEISRTTGEERKYWIKKKQRLLLSLIPFVKY